MAQIFPTIRDRKGNQYRFIRLKGKLRPPGQTVQEITRPGVDGVAFRLQGERTQAEELVSLETLGTLATATLRFETYRGLMGQVVNVIDEYDDLFPDVVVLNVEPVSLAAMIASSGGPPLNLPNGTFAKALLAVKWTVQISF